MELKKVFMLIKRGLTDNTPVCVYPWEVPILNEIHAGNAQLVTIDQLCDLKGGVAKEIKPKKREVNGRVFTADRSPTLREQFESLTKVDPELNPLKDPAAEFARLCALYGMHTDIPLPNAEKVYGSLVGFRAAMKEYAAGRSPDVAGETGPIEEEKPVAEMSDVELKEKLKEMKIPFSKKATREELEDLLTEAIAA